MDKVILISELSVVTLVTGRAWKVTPDNRRQMLIEGELLESGSLVELEDGVNVFVKTFDNNPAPDLHKITDPDLADTSDILPPSTHHYTDHGFAERNVTEQTTFSGYDAVRFTSYQQATAALPERSDFSLPESLVPPEYIPLYLPNVRPAAGFPLPDIAATSFSYQGLIGPISALDGIAFIHINTPITSDNIINNVESQAVTITGTVVAVEARQPVLIRLTDSTGRTLEQLTAVEADGIHWSTTFDNLVQRGLVDGDIQIFAQTSDLSGNVATDTRAFLLDTITEVTIALAHESDSCYGHPGYHSGNPTNDNTPLITGTGEPGATLSVLVDGTLAIGGIKVDSAGNWSAQINSPLSDGSHTIKADITDIPGNTSSAELTITIDTSAGVWINNYNTYENAEYPFTGETTGVENATLVRLDFRSSSPESIGNENTLVFNGNWSTSEPFLCKNGVQLVVSASVEDQACTIATDEMVPLGNPLDLSINEKPDIGTPIQFEPLGSSETALSFDNNFLPGLPSSLSVIDGGITFPLTWQIDNSKTISAIYHDGTTIQTAFSLILPDNAVDAAQATLFKPLLHPLGDNTSIFFTIPYLKSLYSATYQKTHESIAGVSITIFDDAPNLIDHTPVQLAEGTTALWENNNGKLFTAEQAGADGGALTSVNDKPLDDSTKVTSGSYADYFQFTGNYGTLFVTSDGSWEYQAESDLIHTTNTPLSETFTFTVTDNDGDSASATITFNVVDGTPLSFSSATADSMTIDQECNPQSPDPLPDNGLIEVVKGSDPIIPEKLQIDLDATTTAINKAMSGLSLTSHGVELDLSNLYPDTNLQSITLKTVDGASVIAINLQNIETDSNGNLTAKLNVLQKASLDVSSTEPAIIPVIINVSDQDINTISHTVTLAMIDGGITLADDYIKVTEGESVTGNLLANDQHCLDPMYVTSVQMNTSILFPAVSLADKEFKFLAGTSIPTAYGTFVIGPNGDYQFSANKGLDNSSPLELQFSYTVTDSGKDTASASVFVTIEDGEAPSGGELVSLSFTEANLETSPGYPVFQAGSAISLDADGTDPIDPETLTFTVTAADLNGVITSLGSPVEFMVNGNMVQGSVTENGVTTEILNLTLRFADTGRSSLAVRLAGELARPLDHLAGKMDNSHVSVDGERIVLNLPFTYQDIDGSQAKSDGLAVTEIFDGILPALINPIKLNMVEKNLPVSDSGTITAVPNSDQIVPESWAFTDDQPGLTGLFANDIPLEIGINGQALSLYTAGNENSPILTMELNNFPHQSTKTSLSYTATLHQAMNQNKGTWPLSIQVMVTDSDGDITEDQILVSITDKNTLSLSLNVDELSMTEPKFQGSEVSEQVGMQINADTDAVTHVYFIKPNANSNGYAIDDDGNVLTADGLPIRFYPAGPTSNPNETWEAWSMDNDTQSTHIFTISTLQPDGSSIYVDSGQTIQACVSINWYSFIDHVNTTDDHVQIKTISHIVQALDADGSTVNDVLTLSLHDGSVPTPGNADQPAATTDINTGSATTVDGIIYYAPGSDRPIPVFDLQAIEEEFSGFSSDGNELTGYTLSGVDQSVLTISRANDNLPVLRFSINDVQPSQATIQFEQLDNLDHPPSYFQLSSNTLNFKVPVLLSDSDKSLNGNPMSLDYTVIDTMPEADGDCFKPNDEPIATEGDTIGFNKSRSLLANDTLGADADNAFLGSINYDNVYPTQTTGNTVINTEAGTLTVKRNGQWKLQTNPHINHSSGQNFTLKMSATIMDGDGDISTAPFEITIQDQPATFQNIEDVQGLEDTSTPIPVKFALNLGDHDRQETISSLFINSSNLQNGQLTYNGQSLPVANNGQVSIPMDAMSHSVVNGDTIFTANNLGYLPAADSSNFTYDGHQITLNLIATISKDPGPDQTVKKPLVIDILGVADPPVWPEDIQPVTSSEDQVIDGIPIQASLKDTDGSEVLTYQITSFSPEITLNSAGTIITANTILTPQEFASLSVTPEKNWAGQGEIQVKAIATEQGYYSTESADAAATIYVNVFPVADQPTLSVYPTGAQSDLVILNDLEDQKLPVGDHIRAALTDDDGSESLFLRVQTLLSAPGESPGSLWIKNSDNYTEVSLSDGYFEVAGDSISNLYYQPSEDRSSANFQTLKLQINAISRESSQDGIDPPANMAEAISDACFMQINLTGVPDEPVITVSNDWTVDDSTPQTLIGHGYEDAPLPLKFTITSGDIDGSESLNTVISLDDSAFKLQDSQGKSPPIANVVNGKPVYQVTPQAIADGTYSLTAPQDFAGQTTLTLNILVTEADGASQTFTYQLNAVFQPVVDTANQASDDISGKEVAINSAGQYESGGAPLSFKGIQLKDDASEAITDITAIQLPAGFAVLVNGKLMDSVSGSLATLLGGPEAMKTALANKTIIIVPVNDDGTINNNYPTPDSHTTDFTFNIDIQDTQNGLTTDSIITINSTINWSGEVDGGQSGTNPNENTQVTIGNPGPLTGNDFPLTDLQLVSTDTDGSETLMDNKVPQYEINVFDQASDNMVTSGWNLQTSGNQQLFFDNKTWLVQSGGLSGVSVHFTRSGSYFIQIKGIVEDIGDQEARFARMSVTVENDNGITTDPESPQNVVFCTDPVSCLEDYTITIPPDCIDLSLTNTAANEQTMFQFLVSDMDGWKMSGYTSSYWGNNGDIISYLVSPEDLASVSFTPPRDFSGSAEIDYQILKLNTDSDNNSSTTYTIAFDVAPVVENSPGESPQDSKYDLKVWTNPPASAPEWKESNQSSLINLHIEPTDINGSETLQKIVFTPPDNILLKGNGLTDNTATVAPGETEQEFEQRIASFSFIPEQALDAGTYPMSFDVTVVDTAPGTGKTASKIFTRSINLIVTPINNCSTVAAPDQAGLEDNIIPLTGLSALLNDNDGSETMSVTLSQVPDGAVITDAAGQPLPHNGNEQWQIPASLISDTGAIQTLNFQPAKDFSGTINLKLNAFSHETSLTEVCTDSVAFSISVQPEGDAITVDQLSDSYNGDENSVITLLLNARSTDTSSDKVDLPEGIKVTMTITDSGGTLFPPDAGSTQPTIQIPDSNAVSFTQSGTSYTASVTTDNTQLQRVDFNTGDGYGTVAVTVTIQSVDSTAGMTTSYGPEVTLNSNFTIVPKSDPPTLEVTGDHLFSNINTAIPLFIKASVINPAATVETPVGTELFVEVSGLPTHASLVDGQLNPVGQALASGSWAITSDQLTDLYLQDSQVANYNLSIQAVSDVGGGDRQTSSAVPVSVFILADNQPITGAAGDNIIIANGSAQIITGSSGNDLIAAGKGHTTIYPGSGNDQVWGGAYLSTEQNHQNTYAFNQNDNGSTIINDYEPGVDHIDLSNLLALTSIWNSSVLADQVQISEVNGNTQIVAGSQTISLDAIPMDVLLPTSSAMTTAEYLSELVGSGNLVVSNQYGHEGTDILHAPAKSALTGTGIVYGGGGNDTIFANSEGSEIQGGPGDNQLILDSNSHAKDTLYWLSDDAGTPDNPYLDQVTGFGLNEDVIDISGYLPKEAETEPYSYMQLTNSDNDTCLNIANAIAGQWTNTIELTGVDWLQGNTSEEALKQQIEQNYLITGFTPL